jgi:hypothetical protein
LLIKEKRKVLLHGFLRSLKDPFLHARKAGLMGLSITVSSFTAEDIAKVVLPNVSPLTVDPDKTVQDQAFSTIEMLLSSLKELAAKQPEVPMERSASVPKQDSGGDGWASWAISAVSASIKKGSSESIIVEPTPSDSTKTPHAAMSEGRRSPVPRVSESERHYPPPRLSESSSTSKPMALKPRANQIVFHTNSTSNIPFGPKKPIETSNNDNSGWDDDIDFDDAEGKAPDLFEGQPKKNNSFSPKGNAKVAQSDWDNDDWGNTAVPATTLKVSVKKNSDWDSDGWGSAISEPQKSLSGPKSKEEREADRLRRKEERESRRNRDQ